MYFIQQFTIFLVTSEKLFVLSVKLVMHVFLLLSTICKLMTSEVQTDRNPKVQGPECMLDGRELQFSALEAFP
jgi:hypothetical protein